MIVSYMHALELWLCVNVLCSEFVWNLLEMSNHNKDIEQLTILMVDMLNKQRAVIAWAIKIGNAGFILKLGIQDLFMN